MYLRNLIEAMTKATANEDQDAAEARQQVRILTYFANNKGECDVLFKGTVGELSSFNRYGEWIVVDVTRSFAEKDVPVYNRPYVITVA